MGMTPIPMGMDSVLELREGGLGGPGPLSSDSAPDPHYRLALRARHKAPLKTL